MGGRRRWLPLNWPSGCVMDEGERQQALEIGRRPWAVGCPPVEELVNLGEGGGLPTECPLIVQLFEQRLCVT